MDKLPEVTFIIKNYSLTLKIETQFILNWPTDTHFLEIRD